MIVELNKSIPDNIRKKTLRWFIKEIGMTSEGLLKRMGGKHLSQWSGYLGSSKRYAKYDGYQKMAEAYGISEDQFIRKMEEFIREDLGADTRDPDVAFFAEHGISDVEKQKAILQMVRAFSDIH